MPFKQKNILLEEEFNDPLLSTEQFKKVKKNNFVFVSVILVLYAFFDIFQTSKPTDKVAMTSQTVRLT